MSFAIVHTEGY